MDAAQILARLLLASAALLISLPARAAVLYTQTRVSELGLTGNSIAAGNTSRNLAVGAEGTIYAVFRGTNGIRVASSTDRGHTFGASVQLTSSDFEAEIAVASTGIVYVVWSDGSNAQISRSLDGGASFAAPVTAGAASGTVHMATDASHVYLVDQNAINFHASADNGLSFSSVILSGPPQVFADVLVAPDSGEVFIQVDNPIIQYYTSTDQGATFGALTPPAQGGLVYYSVGSLSVGAAGRYIITSGSGTDAIRVDVDANTSQTLVFGNNSAAQGRSLVADRCGNVVDGYVDGSTLQFHVSLDLGDTFGSETQVASVTDPADQNANVFIDQTSGNVLFLYTQSGEVFLSVYEDELPCYSPKLSTSSVAFSAQLLGTTSAAQVVHLTNTGGAAIEISAITATGNFAQTSQCVGSLAPDASCDISVTFTPVAAGTRNGQIQITTTAFPQRDVNLTGLGVMTAPVPQFSPSPLEFGRQLLNSPSESTVTLRNAGNQDLAINEFNITGAFKFTSECPAILAPDASCDLQVIFSADAASAFSGALTLDSDAPGAPASVALTGTGEVGFAVNAAVTSGEGTISPGSVTVLEGKILAFTVTPSDGYAISTVSGCGGTLTGSTYTTAAITEACTISANFDVVVSAHGKGGGGALNLATLAGLLFSLLMRTIRRLRPCVPVLLGLPVIAQAGDFNRWYAGATFGAARTDVTSADMNENLSRLGYDVRATVEDHSRSAWQAYGGFRGSRYFAAQVGYTNLGKVHTSFNGQAADLNAFLHEANLLRPRSADGVDVKLVTSYPLNERLSISAQLGGYRWKSDYRIENDSGEIARRGEHGFDLTYGAGIEFGLARGAALTAAWSRYEISSEKIDLLAIGLQYRWP